MHWIRFSPLLLILLLSCEGEPYTDLPPLFGYSQNQLISNEHGDPVDHNTLYFPKEHFLDTIGDHDNLEYFPLYAQWYSEVLYAAKEPVLYNFYLNRTLFRFTWIRSFASDVILTLEQNENGVFLHEKTLVNSPLLLPSGVTKDHYSIVDESVKELSSKSWRQFNKQVSELGFSEMNMYERKVHGNDGAEWILEFHHPKGYHAVNRWSPGAVHNHKFRKICDLLIDLSSFKEAMRY